MKARKYLLPVFMGLAIAFTACDKEAEDSCEAEDVSDDFGCPADVTAIATFCVGTDANNPSYYAYNGEAYYCSGIEANTCNTALNTIGTELLSQGCSAKSAIIETQLSAMAENLLVKVKSQSLCD